MKKTPEYTLRAQKSYQNRLKDKGWKYFSVIAPPTVVAKLKECHKRFMAEENAAGKPIENKAVTTGA